MKLASQPSQTARSAGFAGRILIVEDSVELAEGLRDNLEMEGHTVRVAHDGKVAWTTMEKFGPDLFILDLMLPGLSGFDLLRDLRESGVTTPVLILSARSEQMDKLRGFRLGADDFVTKPFDLFELLARVEAILRRGDTQAPAGEEYEFADVRVNVSARVVEQNGADVELSPKEFDLLVTLLRQAGKAVSRDDLLRWVWNHKGRVRSRTVDTHMAALRKKLEPDPTDPRHFKTVAKVGYRFEY